MRGRGGCTTEGINLAVSSWEQTSPPHPFPFLSEDGLGAGGESASSKCPRAPISLPARALHRPFTTREAGDGCEWARGARRAGPDAGVGSARPGSAGWPGPSSRRPPPPALRAAAPGGRGRGARGSSARGQAARGASVWGSAGRSPPASRALCVSGVARRRAHYRRVRE